MFFDELVERIRGQSADLKNLLRHLIAPARARLARSPSQKAAPALYPHVRASRIPGPSPRLREGDGGGGLVHVVRGDKFGVDEDGAGRFAERTSDACASVVERNADAYASVVDVSDGGAGSPSCSGGVGERADERRNATTTAALRVTMAMSVARARAAILPKSAPGKTWSKWAASADEAPATWKYGA